MRNPLTDIAVDPQATAERLAALPQVVGMQIAGATVDGTTAGAAGVTDLDAPVAVTADTRFRPGSIAKLVTATLVMQCVDDGLVALDDAVRKYVPEFELAVPGAADAVAVRHLIAHSSGIDAGDLFVDTGDDAGSRLRYVELLKDAGVLFEPGSRFSYNNAGFVLAGLVVERARDASFEDVARQRVFAPLGMERTAFLTGREEDERDDTAAHARGHLAGLGGALALPRGTLTDDPACTRALAPAGGTLSSTASDLVRLAASHLRLPWVAPVLSEPSAALMRELHTPAPGGVTKMAGVGFGWQVWRAADGLVSRIGGANPGQSGTVAVDPRAGAAIAVLSNSDQGVNVITASLDGFGPAATPDDDPAPTDLTPYSGTYACHAFSVAIEDRDGTLVVRVLAVEDVRWGATRLAGLHVGVREGVMEGLLEHTLTAVDRTTFASPIGPIAFVGFDASGRPDAMRWRMRLLRRATT